MTCKTGYKKSKLLRADICHWTRAVVRRPEECVCEKICGTQLQRIKEAWEEQKARSSAG